MRSPAVILVATLSLGPLSAQAGPSADALNEIGIDQRLDAVLPQDLRFRDQTGAVRSLGEFFGERAVALNLVYFDCPMLCSLSLEGALRSFQDLRLSIGTDFDVVTVSFDPSDTHQDAAAQREKLVERYGRAGAEGGWHFLTGDAEAIGRLTKAVGFRYFYDETSGEFAHASALMVLTPEGRLSRYLYGVDYPPRDLRLALVEASAGDIGTAVDAVLLYCYRYDPTTGQYTLAVMNLMRLGGALTLGGIAALLIFFWRRERRAAPAGPEGQFNG